MCIAIGENVMKAIANIKELSDVLYAESKDWMQKVYASTGVIPIIHKGQKDAVLFSNCGYIDLDMDAVYHTVNGMDLTEYCVITKADELIQYIRAMESYKEYLINSSLGRFSKADLFWGIIDAIVTAPENFKMYDGAGEQAWELTSMGFYHEHLTLQMVLIDYDMAEIWIDITQETTLEDALYAVATEMNKAIEGIENMTVCQVYLDRIHQVPNSFEELYVCISPVGEFRWLNDSE